MNKSKLIRVVTGCVVVAGVASLVARVIANHSSREYKHTGELSDMYDTYINYGHMLDRLPVRMMMAFCMDVDYVQDTYGQLEFLCYDYDEDVAYFKSLEHDCVYGLIVDEDGVILRVGEDD